MSKEIVCFLVVTTLLAIQLCSSLSDDQLDTGNLSRKSFPEGFMWGTATSAYQVEGMASKDGRGPSIWDVFVKEPGRISNNATGEVSCDQYNRYKEDVDLMVKLNFDAYRFSISWSRIFTEGSGKVNWKGVMYYNRLINYLLEKGITPYVTLNHFDLPQALHERYGGYLSEEIVKDFVDYAEFCFKTFGDRVKNWFSFNEPKLFADLGYNSGFFPPGRCSKAFGNCTEGDSSTEPYIVAHNIIKSHAAASLRYRLKYQAEHKGKFGIVLDFYWCEPLTRSKLDLYATQRARDFSIGWFLHPLVYGEYPKTMQNIVGHRLPKFTDAEVKMIKGSFDYVGLNLYTTYYTYHVPKNNIAIGYSNDCQCGNTYSRRGVPIGPTSRSGFIYNVPWGMYKAVMYVKERYGNPTIVVTENGMDQPGNDTLPGALVDTTRIEYYKSYLVQLKKTIEDGANVVGYMAWSLLDNFEWRFGYTLRFGINYVDFNTLKRYPKMSAYWFQKLLQKE